MSSQSKSTTRRKFLAGAAMTGAAAVAMPQISRAQTATLRLQTSWPATDIFAEMCQQYITRVNEMAGGRLKIDMLHGGAVVHPFQVLDGVHGGQIDAAHTVTVYWYGKHKAASLFGTGPVFGFNADEGLGWIHDGGGKELFEELQVKIMKLNVKSFFAMPMPTQPLGWFKKPITGPNDMKGMKYRTVGLAADLMQAMGIAVAQLPGGEIVPAMERGVIDALRVQQPDLGQALRRAERGEELHARQPPSGDRVLRDHVQPHQVQQLAQGAPGDPAIRRRVCILRQRVAGDASIFGRPSGTDRPRTRSTCCARRRACSTRRSRPGMA